MTGRKLEPPPLGNTRHLQHGAFSKRVPEDAGQIADDLMAELPHLQPTDRAAVVDYVVSQLRVWEIERWLQANGAFDSRSRPRPALEHLRRWMATAQAARSRLGLDPMARVSLKVGSLEAEERTHRLLEQELESGRRMVEARADEVTEVSTRVDGPIPMNEVES